MEGCLNKIIPISNSHGFLNKLKSISLVVKSIQIFNTISKCSKCSHYYGLNVLHKLIGIE